MLRQTQLGPAETSSEQLASSQACRLYSTAFSDSIILICSDLENRSGNLSTEKLLAVGLISLPCILHTEAACQLRPTNQSL